MNKKTIFLIIALILIIGLITYLESKKIEISNLGSGVKVSNIKDTEKIIEGVKYPLSPELDGIEGYLNSENGIKISDFEGKVVLVDFWTYTCINCIRTIPFLTSWDMKYKDKGLVIIGVHAPEFEFEKDKSNVMEAIERFGINYPVVQDNNMVTWRAFNNRYWPAKYLIDSEGYIRYSHFGEGNYEETENKIKELLGEIGTKTSEISLTKESYDLRFKTTQELYAGALFALPREQYIGNKKTVDRTEYYTLPDELNKKNVIYLDGNWTHNADNLQLNQNNGVIALDFTASEVNIVSSSKSKNSTMEVFIDGKYVNKDNAGVDVQFDGNRAFVLIDSDRLYNLYKGDYGNYRIDLKVNEGFTFNAFTFG